MGYEVWGARWDLMVLSCALLDVDVHWSWFNVVM